MKSFAVIIGVLFFTGACLADDAETDSLVRIEVGLFMEALQEGNGEKAASMFSSQALVQVETMLNTIKQSYRSDSETTMRRLNNAGYDTDAETVRNWATDAYLASTLSLPMISARYMPYEIEIDSVSTSGTSATVYMVFRTAAGAEIPQQAVLALENGAWKITSFMAITAFP